MKLSRLTRAVVARLVFAAAMIALALVGCAAPGTPDAEAQRAAYCTAKAVACALPLRPDASADEKYARDAACAVNVVCAQAKPTQVDTGGTGGNR